MVSSRRREALTLPSLLPHILGALALLAVVFLLIPALALGMGDARDARAGGSIPLAALPAAPAVSPLDAEGDLPDLLQADVLIGDNPTEDMADAPETDALGNVVGNTGTNSTAKTIVIPDDGDDAGLRAIDPTLTRSSEFGPIPGPNAQGLAPLSAYRRPAPSIGERKPVSVVVGGLGINGALTRRAISELPPEVTLSFAAHAPDLQSWIDRARAAGHEVLLEIPMESAGFDASEPGAERALRVSATPTQNRDNLHRVLTRAQGYAGVINYNGDLLLQRSDLVAPLLGELSDSGLALIADGSFSAPSLRALAGSTDVPFAQGFGLIDPSPDLPIIQTRLSELSTSAQAGGPTIGVGFAYPQTINALKGWITTLPGDGLALVPATSALR